MVSLNVRDDRHWHQAGPFCSSCLVGILSNTPDGVKHSGLGAHACLKCCGSGMLTTASGREFQHLIVPEKYEYL